MLTKKQNLLETIHGGAPDRFVNQFEAVAIMFDPITATFLGDLRKGKTACKAAWGITLDWPEDQPGPFPNTRGDKKVIKDITRWKESLTETPQTEFADEQWKPFVFAAEAIDRNEQFVAASIGVGLFEKLHFLMGMEDVMVNLYLEPEAMHELIDYITEYELAGAREACKHLHPDAVFHNDDWGSQRSSFLSPEMFGEFIVPAYKRIYSFWKDNGAELIFHHSDSYAANLVPQMIDMGIDIWQGTLTTNNIPNLIREYGGKISFQGGMDNGILDRPDWTKEKIAAKVDKMCDSCGTRFYIPSCTMADPESTYPGVYAAVSEAIEAASARTFY